MKVALSARIPANKVTCRKTGFKAHALSGKAVRAFDLLVSYEKFIPFDGRCRYAGCFIPCSIN
jgi:hypothetical protein